MKRNIIKINEEKCNGCGLCIPNCHEGALQVIDGKARLVSDLFCDGLGACIKKCPHNAMQIEVRDAEPYDEIKTMENIILGGTNVIKAHLLHLKEHGEDRLLREAINFLISKKINVPDLEQGKPCGCPGMMQKTLKDDQNLSNSNGNTSLVSQLNNWPIQLKLLNPNAQYLHHADLLIAADCSAFTYANFHNKFLNEKILVMFCPKLDTNLSSYVDKLALIFEQQEIKSITIVKMEVPCCGGLEEIVKQALEKSYKNIFVKSYTIGLNGEII